MGFATDSQLIVLYEAVERQDGYSFACTLTNEPLDGIVINGLLSNKCCRRTHLAVPAIWQFKNGNRHVIRYDNSIPLLNAEDADNKNSYLIIANGRFKIKINYSRLRKIVSSIDADIVMINVETTLLANHEKLRLASQGQLAGIRRVYTDSVQIATVPIDWPCYIFIRKSCLQQIFNGGGIPADFNDFIKLVSSHTFIHSIKIGAALLDLETPQGFLAFMANELKLSSVASTSANAIPDDTRFNGELAFGQNVTIGKNVRFIGPVVICDNVQIEDEAVVARTVIGNGVKVQAGQIVSDQLLLKVPNNESVQYFSQISSVAARQPLKNFRLWPCLSYARFVKRTADIIMAAAVLILFMPVIAIVAVMIKATSRGPIFFGHLRQGLHGKTFRCFKFRSMIVGADDLQAKLRIKNEVDGPQFKMEDDPRVTPIGKFLRDTYLDEIPQFFNVFVGDMSVIGPRPSPEAENSLCAYWRDARLSVRPGITGLWQVCRTRKAGSDFQEWVHYDSQYVRQLSPKLDLKIFWGTANHMIRSFLRQF